MSEYQFLQDATLDTVIPHASDLNIEELLGSIQESSGDPGTYLSKIQQRQLLFFDEHITLYLVLCLSDFPKDSLEACISNLSVRFEVFAIDEGGPNEPGEEEQSSKDLIYSQTVDKKDDPFVIVDEAVEDGGDGNHAYVIWKSEAFLYRPRVRLRHPSVVFTAYASFSPQGSQTSASNDQYLPRLTPASTNIFQPLTAAGEDIDPYLPASRILRLVPSTQPEGSMYNIQQTSYHPIRIIPAASARIRYSRSATVLKKLSTTASLDFEATPFTSYEVVLEEANLSLTNGTVEPLTQAIGFSPPISCPARDDISLVYKLISSEFADGAQVTSMLDISLKVTVLVSDECRPKISMRWRTSVDFSRPTSQSLGGVSNVLRRSIISRGSDESTQEPTTPQVTSFAPTDHGVKISFFGPPSVEVGKPFDWDVFIVNTSTKARKFGLSAVPFRRRLDARTHVPRPSSSSSIKRADEVADAVIDENIVYAMQQNAAPHETDLLCLSTDSKIGPLHPGTCHSTRLRLLPLSPGLLHLEIVRLIDLASNETMEIRDLPDIVAYAKADI
ncbi:TRAPP trafficking subunit Trs65-domain-containing protein [Trichophyton interdigitale]|uniref:TRAPP trafficking subunit Trs65-domain-containing protein n=1 Tax=Trichophyton interdigitale TaxID=101480 RepID=A0A9P4YGV5_9EURO|nr:TRAPP trafficking subunit Trs65-domain-containing protein [Trichophyton interdigitale]KAF3893923.1 TRAPP trafficking subunit Trs65-domain-containing protein [Trichophyton interdigitale]KAG8208232.1 TRAPP trafficking subunit Trs65-domain-containing protein [Trichophyton interdigitale]